MTTVLTLHLLGPFQALDHQNPLTSFATDKVRALLVYLAMEADIPHRRESLATLIYPDADNQQAIANLRKTLYRLRTALDQHSTALSKALLTITRSTIQLNPAALQLDATKFRHTITHRLSKNRLTEDDLEQLALVMALYRGEFAAGLSLADAQPFEEWLLLQRLSFHQQALHLCDVLATGFEQRGDFVQAQQYARQALALEPWREEAHLHLIRLLASNGQKSEALSHYEHCRRVLAEEMGMEPNDEIMGLVSQIQSGKFQPKVSTSEPSRPRLHRFPAQFTSFVGRDRELQAVVGQLWSPTCRLVTLVGVGGMGKTRLSVQVAHQLAQGEALDFTDGLYFVDCAPLSRVEDVPSTIAGAVGLVLQGGTPAVDQIHAYLRAKSVLLVLDNLEQLIEYAPEVTALLEACPQVKVLVTSREPMQVRAEWRYDLEGLDTEAGMESKAAHLFIQRARQVHATFHPTKEDEKAIQQIIRQVGGHPLAIELAATWLRFYDCSTIANEIDRGLDFLETTLRDVPARHRSIRVLFDHSWQLLSATEQKTLRQLSVLRGEWTLAQGTAVANGTPRDLVNLADKSLIRRTHAGRYAIDELIRQFAFEKLQTDSERRAVQTRCATFFLQNFARHRVSLYGMEPQTAIAALRADWVNLRQAWSMAISLEMWHLLEEAIPAYQMFVAYTGFVTDGVADVKSLLDVLEESDGNLRLRSIAHVFLAGWFFQRAQYGLSEEQVTTVLELPEQADIVQWQGRAWLIRAESHLVQGLDIETVRHYLDHAERCIRTADDELGKALAGTLRAGILLKEGALAQAEGVYQETLAQFEELHYPMGMMQTLSHMGIAYRRRALYGEALASHLRCLELAENLNSPGELARHHNNVGAVYRNLQEFDKAIIHFTRAIECDELIGHQRGLAIEKGNLGLIYQETHRYDEALAHFSESVEIARTIGLKGVEANFIACRGEHYADMGQFDLARVELEQGIALARSIKNSAIAATYSGVLAWVYFRLGETEQALFRIDEAAAEQARFNLREMLATSLYTKAKMLMELGDFATALATATEALALREAIGVYTLPHLKLQVLIARLQDNMGEQKQAITTLEELLATQQEEEARANVLFGLWAITHEEQHRQAARKCIEALSASHHRYEDQRRLAALQEKTP